MEQNIPDSLTVFVLPAEHQRHMRTTNMLEGLSEEIKRWTRLAGLFPNQASLLPVVGAILIEADEEWQTGKTYLNTNVENETTVARQNKIYRKKVG